MNSDRREKGQEMKGVIEEFRKIRKRARQGGGPERIEKIHQKGKLTARERIEYLVDAESFVELDTLAETQCTDFGLDKRKLPGDGVVIGHGTISGRPVCLYAHDTSVLGGSGGGITIRKMSKAIDLAVEMRVPFVGLNDSPGGRVQEGYSYLNYSGSIFYSNTLASGVVPQISAVMGACAGFAVYGAALTDFVIMVDGTSQMFITGPAVIKQVTGESIDMEGLGGARVHNEKTGVADLRAKDDKECLDLIRRLLSFLPQNYQEEPPVAETGDDPRRMDDELAIVVPVDSRRPYDIKEVIHRIADNGDFLEIKPEFAKSVVIGFIRLSGRTVGIIGNQPKILAGTLTVDSSDKMARFITFCDAFNIPLVFLVDIPGYFPGVDQEHSGIIRHGAKILYAFCESTVPKICIVLRKCYGGGLAAMGVHKAQGTDLVLAWPTAEISVMGAEGAVEFLHRELIEEAENPDAAREGLKREYKEKFANPYYVARKTIIDDVIEPRETRFRLIKALEFLGSKKESRIPRKHGNMPV